MDKKTFRIFNNGICRIVIQLDNKTTTWGTGFYYGSDWIMTCAHVFPSSKALNSEVRFEFPDVYLPTDEGNIKVQVNPIVGKIPCYVVKKIYLRNNNQPDPENCDIAFIQFPSDLKAADENIHKDKLFTDISEMWFKNALGEVKLGDTLTSLYFNRNEDWMSCTFGKVNKVVDLSSNLRKFSIRALESSGSMTLQEGTSGCPVIKQTFDKSHLLVGLHYAGSTSEDFVISLNNEILDFAEQATFIASLADQYQYGRIELRHMNKPEPNSVEDKLRCILKINDIISENKLYVKVENKDLQSRIYWARYVCPVGAFFFNLALSPNNRSNTLQIWLANKAKNADILPYISTELTEWASRIEKFTESVYSTHPNLMLQVVFNEENACPMGSLIQYAPIPFHSAAPLEKFLKNS